MPIVPTATPFSKQITAPALQTSPNRNCEELKINVTRCRQRTPAGSNRGSQPEETNVMRTKPATCHPQPGTCFLIENPRLEFILNPISSTQIAFLIEKKQDFLTRQTPENG